MAKRRKNQLQPTLDQKAGKLFQEAIPTFEEAEKLFYAGEKAKNRAKRTIAWHRENIHAFKKALQEQGIALDLEMITHRTIRNNLVLYAIEKWGRDAVYQAPPAYTGNTPIVPRPILFP